MINHSNVFTCDRVGDWAKLSVNLAPSKMAPSMMIPVTLIGIFAPAMLPRDQALLSFSSSMEMLCSRAVSWRSAPKKVSGLKRSDRSSSRWRSDPLSDKPFHFWTALALLKRFFYIFLIWKKLKLFWMIVVQVSNLEVSDFYSQFICFFRTNQP